MKQKLLFIILLLPFVGVTAQETEENTTALKNNLRIDPLRVALSDEELYRWQISYERTLSENFTALLAYEKGQFEVGALAINTLITEEYIVKGDAFLIEGRYYPLREKKPAPRGFFVGAYYKQYWLTESNHNSTDPSKSFEREHGLSTFGIDAGYKFGKKCFLIEPLVGYGIASATNLGEDKRISPSFGSYDPIDYTIRVALNIGIFF